MFHYVLRFGCAQGFYGGVGEHNLMKLMKYPARNTQKHPDSFTPQLAMLFYQTKILELAWESVKLQLVHGVSGQLFL